MRVTTLNAAKAGINRLHTKGSPSPDTLYDLLNGYVNAAGKTVSRPGTVVTAQLPTLTKGLCAFNGGLVVFSHIAQVVPTGYTCEVVINPVTPTLEITDIHFAGPFLGALYVAAQFSDGGVFHYWLQRRSSWKASTIYTDGDMVEPSVRNGYAYRAHRLTAAAPAWTADALRAVGDKTEPTAANGYQYTVTNTVGTKPRSGKVEPKWPAQDGATINEDTDLTGVVVTPDVVTTPPPPLPPDITDRYRNPGGSRPGGSGVL